MLFLRFVLCKKVVSSAEVGEFPGYSDDIKHHLLFCLHAQGHLERSSPPPFHPPSLTPSLSISARIFHASLGEIVPIG